MPLRQREYVALVCPVTARPEEGEAAHVEGTVISPEQETPAREAAEQAESLAESTTSDLSDLSEAETEVEPGVLHMPGLQESDLRESMGVSCWSQGGAKE